MNANCASRSLFQWLILDLTVLPILVASCFYLGPYALIEVFGVAANDRPLEFGWTLFGAIATSLLVALLYSWRISLQALANKDTVLMALALQFLSGFAVWWMAIRQFGLLLGSSHSELPFRLIAYGGLWGIVISLMRGLIVLRWLRPHRAMRTLTLITSSIGWMLGLALPIWILSQGVTVS